MNKKYIILLIFVWFWLMIPYNIFATENAKVYLESVSLEDFIKFIAKQTQKNISYNVGDIPKNAKITIFSPLELTNEDLLKIFYNILKTNGLVTIKKGETLIIVKRRDIKRVDLEYESPLKAPPDNLVTTIIRLENIDVNKLREPLRYLISEFGHVSIIPGLNTVVITDTKERIIQIQKFLKDIDNDWKFDIRIVPIKSASSQIVEKELKTFFTELAKKKSLIYKPIIQSETVGNSLIIAAKKEDFPYILDLINKIITQSQGQKKQKVFYLKNAVAKDVYKVIKELLAKTQAFKQATISYDEATNSIVVFGTPELYSYIQNLIEKLDVPRKQVYIEALIIETSLSKLSEFGVEWSGLAKVGDYAAVGGHVTTGTLSSIQGSILSGEAPTVLPGGFMVGVLGDVVTYQGTKFFTLGSLLNVLKSDQGINILSNPKILTLDNQKAEIFVGENRPFLVGQKYDSQGNPIFTYDYRDVGVKLTILPHINDDYVLIDVDVEVKKLMEDITVGQGVAPVTLTRSTKTKISLKDGEKIIISGLIKNDKSYTEHRIPVLSSIPILGNLFRYKQINEDKTNLIIFLTTKIINSKEDLEKFQKQEQNVSG